MFKKITAKIQKKVEETKKSLINSSSLFQVIKDFSYTDFELKKFESQKAQAGCNYILKDAYKNIGYGVDFNYIKHFSEKAILNGVTALEPYVLEYYYKVYMK